ncbi:hypothetical protein K2173_010441 [Erythroxylum novogranatense]|uniref:Pentatricopeptide repeat-containing protein n=1 Tax=Erythroxylum novogranatense TaxID=1862640 RepID=A0AAV8UAP1_9ROSI|nr:hypothetical protein K2173_010441 [Erythroxylum novogranatense]
MPVSSSPSILSLLRSCKNEFHLHQLHAHIIRKGFEQDHFVVSQLLSLSTSVSYSKSIFDRVFAPSTVLYNILLNIYSKRSLFDNAISLFVRMKLCPQALPDKYTYPSLIKSCSNECKLKEGEVFHGMAIRCGVSLDVYVGSSLIDLYGKCKEIVSAHRVFSEMSQRNVVSWTALIVGYVNVGDLDNGKRMFDLMPERNVMSWNAMIDGCVKGGDLSTARKLFDEMPERDVVSYTAMIDGYAKAGDMESARSLFEEAPKRDIVAWSALIWGYAQNGQPNEAVDMFMQMLRTNVKPDEFVMVSLMSACSQVANLDLAKWVDAYLSQSSIDTGQAHVATALVDMNAKCGNMDRAKKLFAEMPTRDLIAYCSMIQGLTIHGRTDQAVVLFDRMLNEGITPDEGAFTVILTACSRGGLVNQGWYYFQIMKDKYSVVPTPGHYACMVDLLGRAGQLNSAYELLKSVPVSSNVCAWGALLGACKLYCDVELGQIVANELFELEPQNAANYVLLSNIYAAADRWLDVSLVREKMNERGVRKIPGRSWI